MSHTNDNTGITEDMVRAMHGDKISSIHKLNPNARLGSHEIVLNDPWVFASGYNNQYFGDLESAMAGLDGAYETGGPLFASLKGKTITRVSVTDGKGLIEIVADGTIYHMYHAQDCCESVWLEDTVGSWGDIVGYAITDAYKTSDGNDWQLWTYYTICTMRGTVTLRWNSENGKSMYYSLDVDFTVSDKLSEYDLITLATTEGTK